MQIGETYKRLAVAEARKKVFTSHWGSNIYSTPEKTEALRELYRKGFIAGMKYAVAGIDGKKAAEAIKDKKDDKEAE